MKEKLPLLFVKLVFLWTVLALSFEMFMITLHFANPELETKIGNEIMWKIDGTFKDKR